MKQTITIQSLESREVNTKNGPLTKFIVNRQYSAFKGQWNQDWAVGKTVEADVVEVVKDGKKFYNLRPLQRFGGGGIANTDGLLSAIQALTVSIQEANGVIRRLLEREEITKEISQNIIVPRLLSDKDDVPPVPEDEPEPMEDTVDITQIPF